MLSAGLFPRNQVHPLAVRVLLRVGMDIGGRRPKSLEQFKGRPFDYLVTLADDVRDAAGTR